MATNNRRIQVSELDFDNIKANLKTFLEGQTEFQDYDFEGSGLSILLDLLAYNTHYNGVYTNLAVNEMFLDSASKRASVVSLAKMLGYTPRSAKCASAVVNARITAPTSLPEVATLPANQPFSTKVDDITYTFYNQEAISVIKSGGAYNFTNVTLVEGTPLQFKYTVSAGQRYVIPNADVDKDTISVQVQENSTSDIYDTYTISNNLTSVSEVTKVYFLKEIDDGLFEITFGDGVLGRALSNGNVVTVKYYVSSLDAPNGARTFTYHGASILGSSLSITTVAAATGGSTTEGIDSIKFNAPRLYAAQNRAVTPDDYKAIIYNEFADAATISVWGGENNNPPVYGKTYICVKPKDATKLTNQQKEYITNNILANRNVVSITPEIMDPEYFNVAVETFVHYNPRETSKTSAQIETIVKNAILDYNDTDLSTFESVLRFSKLSKIIDEADSAIVNNITRIKIHHPHTPKYNVSTQYLLDLINPISASATADNPAFQSTGFYVPNSTKIHYMDDDQKGNIRLYYLNAASEKVIVTPDIGTIDYAGGTAVIRNLTITSLEDPVFDWIIRPESYDVVSALNQIVQIDSSTLTVTAIADATANGDLGAGYNYTFNSIRS